MRPFGLWGEAKPMTRRASFSNDRARRIARRRARGLQGFIEGRFRTPNLARCESRILPCPAGPPPRPRLIAAAPARPTPAAPAAVRTGCALTMATPLFTIEPTPGKETAFFAVGIKSIPFDTRGPTPGIKPATVLARPLKKLPRPGSPRAPRYQSPR